jgi:hypothetical protein
MLIHPAVAAALPPNNARPLGHTINPEQCGEPLALSRHLYEWEKNNPGKRCNPPDKNWQKYLGLALNEVDSINTRGKGGAKPACSNCGQTIPRLWALAGQSPPNSVYSGGVQNPDVGWDGAQNQG